MKNYGLIGKDVTYSYSKIIHQLLAEYYNLEMNYDLISCNDLTDFDFTKYDGLNVTIPYKETVLQYIETQSDIVQVLGTCNTIINNTIADNTDILGFTYAITNFIGSLEQIKSVVILGNSASSKMIKMVFKDANVKIVSRNPKDEMLSYADLSGVCADLLINTTPVTMNNQDKSPISDEIITNFQYVYDLNYNPGINRLMIQAAQENIPHQNGLEMLIMQAIYAFELWHDIKVEEQVIAQIQTKIKGLVNPKVAIIGMPFSGKTTYGKKMQAQGKKVIDLDAKLVENNQDPQIIIPQQGIEVFRDMETSMLEKVINEDYDILILGGGIVERIENYRLLVEHQIFHKECQLSTLIARSKNTIVKRPLVMKDSDLKKLYSRRQIKYKVWSKDSII